MCAMMQKLRVNSMAMRAPLCECAYPRSIESTHVQRSAPLDYCLARSYLNNGAISFKDRCHGAEVMFNDCSEPFAAQRRLLQVGHRTDSLRRDAQSLSAGP